MLDRNDYEESEIFLYYLQKTRRYVSEPVLAD